MVVTTILFHHVAVIRQLHVQYPTRTMGVLIDMRCPDMFHVVVPTTACACLTMLDMIGYFQAKHHVILLHHVPCVSSIRHAQRRGLHHIYYLEPGITTGATLQYAREHHVAMSRILDARHRQ